MALRRLLLSICGVVVIAAIHAHAQSQATEANQDGIIVSDALGRFFSANEEGINAFLFKELEASSQKLGFVSPIIKDVELVGNPDGSPRGAYVADMFGGQFALTIADENESPTAPQTFISSPAEVGANNPEFSTPVFFGFDVIEDLEVAPDWRDTTFGYKGYFLLDADGVVHTLGSGNLPKYVYYSDPNSTDIEDATIVTTLYPETIDVSGSNISPEEVLQYGPLDFPMNRLFVNQNVDSVTPVFTYFGFGSDLARDLEISVEYAELTVPSRSNPGEVENRRIAMTNGYYILDGFGAVHSSRLPLDFDADNDGEVLYTDLYTDFGAGELNPDFGRPINNTVLAPDWADNPDDLPYFGEGADVAVDIEITPSGNGFYLLDAFGGVFAAGDAQNTTFPPQLDENGQPILDENGQIVRGNSTTPFFGFPIARDLALVPNKANLDPLVGLEENRATVGFLVIDGFGTVHEAGLAKSYDITRTGNNGTFITTFSDTFRSVETTPMWLPRQPRLRNFVVNLENVPISVAPSFREVTAAFTSVTAAFVPATGPQ